MRFSPAIFALASITQMIYLLIVSANKLFSFLKNLIFGAAQLLKIFVSVLQTLPLSKLLPLAKLLKLTSLLVIYPTNIKPC